MELLILLNRAVTHAEVAAAPEDRPRRWPPRARVIRPGESYLGLPYDAPRACKDQRVDLFDYTDRPRSRTAWTPEPRAGVMGAFDRVRVPA